jgi:hypothetical protein
MRILAIDPGHTTGVATGLWDSGLDFKLWNAFQLPWEMRFTLAHEIDLADLIVIESFRLYKHKAQDQINSDFPSVQVIGAVEAFAWRLSKLEKIVKQPSSCIQNVKILSEHEEFTRGLIHAQDAYRHLRYYIVTQATETVPATRHRPRPAA